MGIDVKLYTHGVPSGQSVWGIDKDDSHYIESFYGRKSNEPIEMFVEVQQFSNAQYCYYTYIRKGNVVGNSGRTGSYFALTVRINYCYADIKNIYNMLDAAFNKFIVGQHIVDITGNTIKYKITDFAEADSILNALEKEIIHYLEQFSSNPDFISLVGFKANGSNGMEFVNLLECDENLVVKLKNGVSLSISCLHCTKREAKIIKEKEEKIAEVNRNASQQIMDIKQKAQKDIDAANKEKKQSIETIRNQYKNADLRISSLQEINENLTSRIKNLEESEKRLKKEIENTKNNREDYSKIKKELEKKKILLNEIKDTFSKLNLKAEEEQTSNNEPREEPVKDKNPKTKSIVGLLNLCLTVVVLVVLIVFIGINLSGDKENSNVQQMELLDAGVKSNSEIKSNYSYKKESDTVVEENTTVQELFHQLKELYRNAKINIERISKSNPMKCDGSSYTVNLKIVDDILNGEWVSKDFDINGDKIIPRHPGKCEISYIVGNDTLVTRTIDVK